MYISFQMAWSKIIDFFSETIYVNTENTVNSIAKPSLSRQNRKARQTGERPTVICPPTHTQKKILLVY